MLADLRKSFECAYSASGEINDRIWIRLPKRHAGIRQDTGRRLPRRMNVPRVQPAQLRYELADIVAVGVELLSLRNRIENPNRTRLLRAGILLNQELKNPKAIPSS